ncbi:HAD-IA family hydrolase [Candidatus Saccharibacteria bacterium]|nr:HAD-IA family hydrolase [Candidatus Saccharibacteria bacterium]
MIKAIIFDCFGVLVDDYYGAPIKVGLTDEELVTWQKIADTADRGDISNEERLARIFPMIRGGRAKFEREARLARRHDDLLDFILKLRGKYKTGLLSNASDNIVERFFSPSDFAKYFDEVVLSYKVRLIKPYPEIYKLAAQRLSVDTNECLFVDDNPTNLSGAEAVGMHGLLYKNFAKFQTDLKDVLEKEIA